MDVLVVTYIFIYKYLINYFYELLGKILFQNLSVCFMKVQAKSGGQRLCVSF